MQASRLQNALRHLAEALSETEAALKEMRAESDPLAVHIFVSRRQYRNMPDTKSGKRSEAGGADELADGLRPWLSRQPGRMGTALACGGHAIGDLKGIAGRNPAVPVAADRRALNYRGTDGKNQIRSSHVALPVTILTRSFGPLCL